MTMMRDSSMMAAPYVTAASAGTGKTTRLLQDVLLDVLKRNADSSSSIRESLVITFTVAAAAEMRSRIEDSLRFAIRFAAGEECEDPNFLIGGECGELAMEILADTPHAFAVFRQALNDLPGMQISTIDALAKLIVDRNADALSDEVHPGYEVLADDATRRQLQYEMLDELFEQWYDPHNPRHQAFMDVLDNVGGPLRDGSLQQMMLGLYDKALTKPNRLHWLDKLSEYYDGRFEPNLPIYGVNPVTDATIDTLFESLKQAERFADNLKAKNPSDWNGNAQGTGRTFLELLRWMEKNAGELRAATWTDAQAWLKQRHGDMDAPIAILGRKVTRATNLAPIKKGTDDYLKAVEIIQRVQATVKSFVAMLDYGPEAWTAFNSVGARRLRTMVDLIKVFDQRYAEVKRKRSVAEFADVMFLARKALNDPQVLARVNARWSYIYVDECQDDNALQNEFIATIARNAAKLTMVGDVKQSIYGFRDASPDDFRSIAQHSEELDRQRAGSGESHEPLVRRLSDNHRSSPEIISFVNTVFSRLMTEELGGVDYTTERLSVPQGDDDAECHANTAAVELLLRISQGDVAARRSTTSQTPDNSISLPPRSASTQLENDMIVRRIQRLHAEEHVDYGDIMVLGRSATQFGDLYARLTQEHIPATVDGVGDYFDRAEVRMACDWLKILDNPHTNIPLIGVLRQFGFSDAELAELRLSVPSDEKPQYIEILRKSVNNQDNLSCPPSVSLRQKSASFLALYDRLADFSRNHPLDETLWRLYADTGLYDFVAALPEGRQRQANLVQLCDKARLTESKTPGIRPFLDAMEQWRKNGTAGAEAPVTATADAVRIMTIHKSKGLQAKVVLLMRATNELMTQTGKQQLVAVPMRDAGQNEYGVGGLRLLDSKQSVSVATPQYGLLARQARQAEASEEARLLYVALTRAKQRLIISGTWPKNTKAMREQCGTLAKGAVGINLARQFGEPMSADGRTVDATQNIDGKQNYLAWILRSLTLGFGGQIPPSWMIAVDMNADDDSENVTRIAEGVKQTAVPLPDELRDSAAEGKTPQLRGKMTVTVDYADPEPAVTLDGDSDAGRQVHRRIDLNGCDEADDRALARVPLTANASGARQWLAETSFETANDEAMDDDVAVDILKDDDDSEPSQPRPLPLPSFMTGHDDSQSLPSAAELGTAMHAVLELFDWSVPEDEQSCRTELEREIAVLRADGQLSAAAAAAMQQRRRMDSLLWFVTGINGTGIGRMQDRNSDSEQLTRVIRLHRNQLHREMPFTMLVDVSEVIGGTVAESEEAQVVVRGIIDGFIVDEASRSITLFDYKTDVVRSGESIEQWQRRLHDDYASQQSLYARALEELYPGYTVTERWLVGLDGHRLIDVAS